MKTLVSADFFVVPTITFRVLFVFVVFSHNRRRPIHCAVTANPTAEWTARQLLEAFPWDSAPRYLLRDRDGIYGEKFQQAATWLGIREVLTAPQSPWQNPYVERLIGSIRRECLDHLIVLNETGLRRVLKSYFAYYERTRTHLSLEKDAPIPRRVQPPELGTVVEFPEVGGLHHRYGYGRNRLALIRKQYGDWPWRCSSRESDLSQRGQRNETNIGGIGSWVSTGIDWVTTTRLPRRHEVNISRSRLRPAPLKSSA